MNLLITELTKLINESNDIVKWLLFSQVTTQMNMSLGTSFVLFMILRGTFNRSSGPNVDRHEVCSRGFANGGAALGTFDAVPKAAQRTYFFSRFF